MSNTTCPTDTSTCTVDTCSLDCGAHIQYLPSIAANATFMGLFIALLIAQTGLGIFYKTWGFLVGMIFGLALEIVGYIGRLMLNHNPWSDTAFIVYLVPLTIAPAFLSGALYLCLSRIEIVHGVELARLSPRWTAVCFMISDFISLVLQAAGGAIAASADTSDQTTSGKNIMIVGLVWQVVSLCIFMAIWADFAWRVKKAPEERKAQDGRLKSLRTSSKRFIWFEYFLLTAIILILIRSIYRVVELADGFDSTLANEETPFIILEGVAITVAVALVTALHPGFAFKGNWNVAAWGLTNGKTKGHGMDAEMEFKASSSSDEHLRDGQIA